MCKQNVSVFKEYNIKRYYDTHHSNYNDITGNERQIKYESQQKSFSGKKLVFNLVGLTSDGAPSMMGYKQGFVQFLKKQVEGL